MSPFVISKNERSIMWSPQEEARAKRLAEDAAKLTAKARAKQVTSFVPYHGVTDFRDDSVVTQKIKRGSI